MKLHVWRLAPNPRRTLIFLAEKGIDVPTEDVGGDGSRLKPEYVLRYPQATVAIVEMWERRAYDEGLIGWRRSFATSTRCSPDGAFPVRRIRFRRFPS